jgi:tyrosyl-tRNA synthetase
MMAKDSVKKRIETGISFTEFSYQLLQGYDFLHLYRTNKVRVQFGGSDQWGNITTGTELIRKMERGDAYAFTCPLLTKADGGKFGKTESGTVWLDPAKTSPFQFYQFWFNASDADAPKLARFYTLFTKDEIEALEREHNEAPHLRILQKAITEEVTLRVHGKSALEAAIAATNVLFGKSTKEDLQQLNSEDFLSVFEGVPQAKVKRSEIEAGISIVDVFVAKSNFLSSNGEVKRELKANAISVNKEKVGENYIVGNLDLLNNKFILLGKGKKNNYIIEIE